MLSLLRDDWSDCTEDLRVCELVKRGLTVEEAKKKIRSPKISDEEATRAKARFDNMSDEEKTRMMEMFKEMMNNLYPLEAKGRREAQRRHEAQVPNAATTASRPHCARSPRSIAQGVEVFGTN